MFARKPSLVAFALVGAMVPWARAQHGEEKHGEEHGKPAQFTMPANYRAGVAEIDHRLHEISELIEAKKLDQVHTQADVIQKVGKMLGQLALKEDSGVPKEAVKEINLAGKDLAARFDEIDKAGDSGNLAGTQKAYDGMVKVASTLRKYVPKDYACPMKCEGSKTYPQPGKCPKCGMDLKEVAGRGEHGGLLQESADGKHQVEATLSAQGELHIYCYDEHKQPVPADKFAAECRAHKHGGSDADAKAVALAPTPDKSSASGKLDPSLKTPLMAKVSVDFKDGQKPESFEFDFDEPAASASKKHEGHKP